MEVIFTVTDTNNKVTRSVPTELEDFELTRLISILEDFTKLSYFKMTVIKDGGILRQVYFNPKQIVSLGIEEVK